MRISTIFITVLALFASATFALPIASGQSVARRSMSLDTNPQLSPRGAELAAGTYVIVSKVHGANDQQLAITSNGANQNATVTLVSGSASDAQKWKLTDMPNSNAQIIAPFSDSSLQASWGADAVQVTPAGSADWVIRSSFDGGYVIQDAKQTVYWSIGIEYTNGVVTLQQGTGAPEEQWFFQKV